MAKDLKRLTDFLVAEGIDKIPHTKKSYLGHLIAVHRLMQSEGCSEDACLAGMFHSVYGTQRFQGFKLPLERRQEIRDLIGERPERLAYLNCAMDRATFDSVIGQPEGPYRFRDRITGETVEMSKEDYDDLCRVHLYDFLEQIPRLQEWDYRRAPYRAMAARLGDKAVEAYDRVFALEPAVEV